MKAICLASAMTLLLLVAVTLVFRLRPGGPRARQMVLIYLACLLALAVLWLATPDDLGFLPGSLTAEPRWLDLALALFFFSAAFFGGVLQLYNLTDRGFSLRILIDALEAEHGVIDVEELVAGYGGGQGVVWMYDKRMHGLLAGDFVRRRNGTIVLSPKGRLVADLFGRIRQFLKLDKSD